MTEKVPLPEQMDALNEIPPADKKLEAEEQNEIDERIEAARAPAGIPNGEVGSAHEVIPVGELKKERVFHADGSEYIDFVDVPASSETPMIPNREDALDQAHMQELFGEDRTRKEWQTKLRGLIEGAKEKLGMSEQGERLKENLAARSGELDAEAQKFGIVERTFRSWGEKYNKLGWKSKLAVGLSLGIGAGALSTVSLAGAAACLSGIAAQRIAGLSSAFLKYEKNAQEGKWKKEIAMGKAIRNAALMTGAMLLVVEGVKEGIEYAREHEWLGKMLGHDTPAPEALIQTPPTADTLVLPDDVVDSNNAAIMKGWSEFNPGKPFPGYDIASEDIHEHLLALAEQPSASLVSSQEEIVKHLEAMSEEKEALDAALPENAPEIETPLPETEVSMPAPSEPHNPNLFYGNPAEQADLASFPPPPPPEFIQPVEQVSVPSIESQPAISHEINPATGLVDEQPPAPVETIVPQPIEQPIPVEAPEAIPTVDVTHAPEFVSQPLDESVSIPNQFGLEVPAAEPHIYADQAAKELFVYGGSPEEKMRAITEYLGKYPGKIVYGADADGHRVPWFLDLDGKMVLGPPVHTGGFFGLFSSFMEAPRPEDFAKVIK